jgi:gamma-glutamylputrescine oxidase
MTRPEVYWQAQQPVPPPDLVPLERGPVPAVILGGGMAGLMCAERLLAHGVAATLLEASFCGGGASGKSSGFVTPDSELGLADLRRLAGPEAARRLWDFARSGVEAIDAALRTYRLDCDRQAQDSLFVADSPKGVRVVESEHTAHRDLGFESTLYDAEALPAVLGSTAYGAGIRTTGTFGLSPHAYCRGLAKALSARGVRIHEGTPSRRIEGHDVHTERGRITADAIFVCTDRFLPDLAIIPKDVYHAQTCLAATAPLSASDRRRIFPQVPLMVWDSDLIYQYYRMTGDGRLLLGGASLLSTYASRERRGFSRVLDKMRAYFAGRFPDVRLEFDFVWPGLIGVSKDFIPLAGVDPSNPAVRFVAGAAGLPWAAALGRYLADAVLGGRDDFDVLFSPGRRFPLGHAVQAILRKPLTFALSHAVAKYRARG